MLATSKTVTKGDVSRADTAVSYTPHVVDPAPPALAPAMGKPFSEEDLARALRRTKIFGEREEL